MYDKIYYFKRCTKNCLFFLKILSSLPCENAPGQTYFNSGGLSAIQHTIYKDTTPDRHLQLAEFDIIRPGKRIDGSKRLYMPPCTQAMACAGVTMDFEIVAGTFAGLTMDFENVAKGFVSLA